MPHYDYLCDACGRREEVFIRNPNNAPPALFCPHCPANRGDSCDGCVCPGTMHRQIGSGAGVIFRGPGFFSTDYRKTEPPKENT